MYHTIEFRIPGLAELEVAGCSRPTQVYIETGTRIRAQVKSYVVESDRGPVEVADLFSKDGSAARAVHSSAFRFIDE